MHKTPACNSLRVPEVPTKSAKVKPVNLSTLIADIGAKVTETVTFGAFATDEDIATDEPLTAAEKIAGKDPCELAAITMSETSKIAASTKLLGGALAGRLKLPNDKVSSVLAGTSAPKRNSISEAVEGFTLEEEIILMAP